MKIALLNDNDEIISYKDKLIVHTEGLLHRAFSIVIFNSNNEILLQKRAPDKYHSGSLWTNTCCSHLPEGNEMSQFIHTRLKQEMGFDCELNFLEKFHYKTTFENGLIENEIDYLYTGKFDGNPSPDISEVSEWRWITLNNLRKEIKNNPMQFTYWFKEIVRLFNLKNIR